MVQHWEGEGGLEMVRTFILRLLLDNSKKTLKLRFSN